MGQVEGVLVRVKNGWYFGCVEGGFVGVFLSKVGCWGILMDFSQPGE